MERRGVGREQLDAISHRILGASFAVHSALGPGLLESAYEACLEHKLRSAGLAVERQKAVPLRFDGIEVDPAYRIDLLVEDLVVVEVKAVAELAPIHKAQVLTYLKLMGLHVGLLLNFHVVHLRHGVTRVVRAFPDR